MDLLRAPAGVVGAKSSTGEEQWEEIAWINKGVQTFPWTLPAMQVSQLENCNLLVLLKHGRLGLFSNCLELVTPPLKWNAASALNISLIRRQILNQDEL